MSRFVLPFQSVFDLNGVPLDGAKLYFFESDGVTPKDTWTDVALSVANANPVIANNYGQFDDIFLEAGEYVVRLDDKNDVTQPNYPAVPDTIVINYFGIAAGTSDAILVTVNANIASYSDGLEIRVRSLGPNASATPTINVNNIGIRTITKLGTRPLDAGDIPRANFEMTFRYNSTTDKFELLYTAGVGAALSETNAAASEAAAALSETAAALSETNAAASEAAAALSETAAEIALDAVLASKDVFVDTAAGLSKGVVNTASLVGGSGGTNGTFALAFSGGAGIDAAGVFVVAGGSLTQITITNQGTGYTSAPTISFAASAGLSGASATAVIGFRVDVGEYFSVGVIAGDDALILYKVEAGPVATEITRYSSSDRIYSIYTKEMQTLADEFYDEKFAFLDLNTQTAVNVQDGAGLTWSASKVATGLQIVLSTARQAVFSTENKTGAKKTRIQLIATADTAAVGMGFGISDGVDRASFRMGNNGWIVFANTRGGGGIINDDLSTFGAGDVVTMDAFIDAELETVSIAVSVAGESPFIFAVSDVPMGDVELYMDGVGTVTYSMQIEAVSDYHLNEYNSENALTDTERGQIFAADAFLAGYERVAPSGFAGRFPAEFSIYKHPTTGDFLASYDPNPINNPNDPEVVTLYVDIATGSDTALGTAAAPLKGIWRAVSRCGQGSKVNIKVMGGLYPHLDSWRGTTTGNDSTVMVTSWDGNPIISSMHDETLSWTLDTDATYYATFTDTQRNVADASNLTADGDYTLLDLAASLAACKAAANSYFITGTTIYVHLFDERTPDSDVRAFKTSTFVLNNGSNRGLDSSLYMEDIDFEGGDAAFYSTISNAANTQTIHGKRCTFKYSYGGSAPLVNGQTLAIWEECLAAWNSGDGYHYNPIFSSVPADGIELNCNARWNGINAGGVGNSSSNHGGSTLRIKTKTGWGDYSDAEARGIHDIFSTEQAVSWCLGITSRDSRNGYSNFAMGLGAGTEKMWLDGVTSSGTTNGLEAQAGATIYKNDVTSDGAEIGAGTITTYTP